MFNNNIVENVTVRFIRQVVAQLVERCYLVAGFTIPKVVSLVLIIGLILTNFAGCNHKLDRPIKLGYLNISASLPFFVIQEQKSFEQANIKFESTVFQTSNQLVDALAASQIDFIVEASLVPVLAREGKSPGKILIFAYSDISPERPFDAIVSNNPAVKELKDLEGKKVGVFPGSTSQRLLKSFLESKGVKTENITFIQIIPPNMLASLESGYIDALHTYEPTTTIALKTGKTHEVFGTVYGNMQHHNPQGVACVNKEFYTKYTKKAKKVIKIFEDSFKYIEQNEKEAKKILAKYTGLDESVALESGLLYFLPAGDVNASVYIEYANTLKSLGEIESIVPYESISILK